MAKTKLKQLVVKSINTFQVTENVISTIESSQLAMPKFSEPQKENSRHINKIRDRKNKAIVLINPVDKSMICTIPIVFKGRLLVAEFPNLLTLYLNHAILSYNFSCEILNQEEIVESHQSEGDLKFVNKQFYNLFLLNRINLIIYLSMTLELLLNSKIPVDYKHQIKEEYLDKKGIEERLPFKEKLRLTNKILSNDKKGIDSKLFDTLIELYSIRSNLVHPKTADSRLKGHYSMDQIAVTFSDDVLKYINGVIEILKKWEPGLISFEEIA